MSKHFITLDSFDIKVLHRLIERAMILKEAYHHKQQEASLRGRVLAMIFEKPSTRTRVSFESGMAQLGGHAIYLQSDGSQIGRGESLEDTVRVLSKMVDAIVLRTHTHQKLEGLTEFTEVPIINGLSDSFHPCQLLADMMTYIEHRGSIENKKVAWLGDGNNVCHSYMNAARLFNFHLSIACPEGFEPDEQVCHANHAFISIDHDPIKAVRDADLVVTDVWASMGQEKSTRSTEQFQRYQVNTTLMQKASSSALFMHCLPAYRGKEVSREVLEGAQSVVWEEAGNRLHTQKSLLEFIIDQ